MFIILLLSTLITWLIIRHYYKSTKLPPGPISLPLIGNLPQLAYHSWKFGGIVPAFNYYRKVYGNVFTLWMGPTPHVNVTDYDTSHQLFIKNCNKFADRFSPPIFKHLGGNQGLFFANGEKWAELRRFTLLTFRNMGVGRDIMEERILEELDARCADIDKDAINGRVVVQTTEFFELLVGNVINRLLVGKRFDDENKHEFLAIKEAVDRGDEVFTMLELMMPVWILKYIFPSRYRLIVSSQVESIDAFMSKEVYQRVEKYQKGEIEIDEENPNDFVDAFLVKMKAAGFDKESVYSFKSLKITIADLWLAGQGTTTVTLISGFNQLIHHPDVIDKIREEVIRVTDGNRPLSMKDRLNTPYLNATIAEIQRHASILNINFWRENHEIITVGGYPVDKGALISAQLSTIHINDEIFENPEKFDSSRFIKNEKLLHQIIPFGIGKRSCVGENIARNELYLMTGNLIMRYDFKPHGKLPELRDFLPFSAVKIPDRGVKMEFIKL